MFNKFGKNLKLRKIIIATAFLIFALILSCGIVFFTDNLNHEIQQPDLEVSQNNFNPEHDDPGLVLEWIKEPIEPVQEDKIQPLSETSGQTSIVETDSYTITYDSALLTINAGTTITISCDTPQQQYTLTFSGGTAGAAVFLAKEGYNLTTITLGNGETEVVYTYTTSESGGSGFESVTTEQLDPNYSGRLIFKVTADAITYDLSGMVYYKNSGTYNGVLAAQDYSVVESKSFITPDITGFLYWHFDSSNIDDGYQYNDDHNGTLTIWKENDCYLTITYSTQQYENSRLRTVTGWGTIPWAEGIISAVVRPYYNLYITNNSTYWSDLGKTGNDLLSLCGVTNSAGQGVSQTSLSISNVTETTFRFTSDKALTFSTNRALGMAYLPYNYGHEINGYYVQIDSSNSTYDGKYLMYDADNTRWVTSSNKILGVDSSLQFSRLARFADSYSGRFEFTITPDWSPVNITVSGVKSDGNNDQVFGENEKITFGRSYALESPTQVSQNGKTFFCYKQGDAGDERLIANKAIWNYTNLTGATQQSDGSYKYNVQRFDLDNVYKVDLNTDSILDENNVYTLKEESVHIFASGAISKPADGHFYSYNSSELMGELTAYNNEPLVETYVSNVMQEYIDNYEEMIDSDGKDDSGLLNQVFYSGGNATDEKVLNNASSNSIYVWIYLANNHRCENLPMFDHENAQIIVWEDNQPMSYKTAGYKTEYSNELKSNINDGTWVYGENSTEFSAVYVYRLKLYYEDNNPSDGTYSSINAEWFGGATPLQTPELSVENLADDKSFKRWMFHAGQAELDGYSVNVTGNTIRATKDADDNDVNEVDISFVFESNTGVYYFGITEIQGIGLFVQNSSTPILTAQLKSTYVVVIDNSATYWEDFSELSESEQLFGAVSSGELEEEDDFRTTRFEVSDVEASAYPFQNSINIAFYRLDQISSNPEAVVNSHCGDNYYYVYNYGHYITGWTIEYNGKYYYYDGTWKDASSLTVSKIDHLNSGNNAVDGNAGSQNLSDFAGVLDDMFPYLLGSNREIKLTPVWETATVTVKEVGETENLHDDELIFGESGYTLEMPTENSPQGKTFFSYWNNNCVIANSAEVWNYTNLIYNPVEGEVSKYVVEVTQKHLDNIYKVTLNNVISAGSYTLENYGYTFATSSISGESYSWQDFKGTGILGDVLEWSEHSKNYYPLVDKYIEDVLGKYVSEYETGISKTNSFNILQQVFSSNGTVSTSGKLTGTDETTDFWIYFANNQELRELPMFAHDYAQIIAWNDSQPMSYKTEGYVSTFASELKSSINGGTWVYSEDLTLTELTAVYIYRLKMYYEDVDGGAYSSINAEWYGKNTKLEIKYTNEGDPHYLSEDAIPERKDFVDWMFNRSVAEDPYGYTVEESGNTLKVTGNGVDLSFRFGSKSTSSFNGNTYYFTITEISGYGLFSQEKYSETGKQYLILTARLKSEYDFTFDNSSTYWSSFNETKENSNLYGAAASSEIEKSEDTFATTTISVSSKQEHAYPLQNSIGIAFYHLSDIMSNPKSVVNSHCGDNYYYVYNYGHYITGWTIKSSLGWLKYNNGWQIVEQETENKIENLNNAKLNQIAEIMDNYFVGYTGIQWVTLTPTWKETNIQICETTTTFRSDYTAGVGLTAENGKTLFALDYVEGEGEGIIVAADDSNKAIWNYQNIPHGEFTYYATTEQKIGEGVYTINVEPIWVDNIYKIELKNVQNHQVDLSQSGDILISYLLNNCDYQFANYAGAYSYNSNTYDLKEFNFKNYLQEGYAYQTFKNSGETLVDNYLEALIELRNEWAVGISGSFEILRKVYHSQGGTTATTNQTNDTLKLTNNSNFWIYLGNGQNTGALPIFKKEYYVHIYWKNINHVNSTNCSDNKTTSENECNENNLHYIYPTNDYDEGLHSTEISNYLTHLKKDEEGNNVTDENGNLEYDTIWYYGDGYSNSSDLAFEAYYFRKSYQMSISTLLNGNIDRRGYVHVYIKDGVALSDGTGLITDTGANYIIIADSGIMKIYKIGEDSQPVENISLINTNIFSNPLNTETFRVYGGCDIYVYIKDQSKDIRAMESEQYDSMIGYKFSGRIEQTTQTDKLPISDNNLDSKADYEQLFDKDVIDLKNYTNNDIIHFDVHYEKILYNLTVKIDDVNAGEFNLAIDDTYSGNQTTYVLNNFDVGTYCRVNYLSYAGFKLQENAFVLNNKSSVKILQSYNDINKLTQMYTITGYMDVNNLFDGKWLRTYFYSDYDDYAVNRENLGELIIQTEPIEFNFGVLISDETTGIAKNKYVIETINNVGTVAIADGTDTATIDVWDVLNNYAGEYLKVNDEGLYYYHSLSLNTDYALLSSKLYFPNNYTTINNNYYTTYDFLLKSLPDGKIELKSPTLAMMVKSFDEGVIIPVNNRNIYIMIEVRKLYEITVRVDASNIADDSNDSTRITTLSNSNANIKQVIVNAGANTNGEYFANSLGEYDVKFYTYHGLENHLNYQFDVNRYSEVVYYLDGALLSSDSFVIEADMDMEICYIPKGLQVEFVYNSPEGSNVDISTLSTYIKENKLYKPTKLDVYYLSDDRNKVPYFVECIHNDYNVRVTINDMVMGVTDNLTRSLSFIAEETDNRYTVRSRDFDKGKIQIVVDIITKDASMINVRFQLRDSGKLFDGDDFGTFDVYTMYNSNKELLAENVSSTQVDVVEFKDVYVVVNLKAGYEFEGYKHNTYNIATASLDQNKTFLMISGFNPEISGGDYLIIIDKITLNATLDVSGLKAKYDINGTTSLSNLYVGSTIQFGHADISEERLGCFYYLTAQDEKVYLTDDGTETGNPLTICKITSEMLEAVNSTTIRFGVVAVNRYKVEISITGKEYLDIDKGFTVNYCDNSSGECVVGEEYVLGTYCDAGTQITFSVKPAVVGKFDINVQEADYNETFTQIFNGSIITTFNKNYSYSITISPKQYNVEVNEFVYETIVEVKDGKPKEVLTADQVNGLTATGQKYNEIATLEFVRSISGDRCLSYIQISKNDMSDSVEIVLDGVNYRATVDGSEVYLKDLGFTLEITSKDTIKLQYTTYNDISIKLEYKDYKVIEVG